MGATIQRCTCLVYFVLLTGGCVRAGFDDAERGVSGADGPAAHDLSAGADLLRAEGPAADQAGCTPQQQVLQILADADDGEIDYDGSWLKSGEDSNKSDPAAIYIGYWSFQGQGHTWSYLRFRLTRAIPAQATAVSGKLELHGLTSPKSSGSWDSAKHALRVLVEDAADADMVTAATKSPGSSGGRAAISPTARWPATGGLTWTTGAYNTLDTLGPPLQALIVKRSGLAAGAYVQLWLRGDFVADSAEVATPDIGRPGYVPAKLSIAWCD